MTTHNIHSLTNVTLPILGLVSTTLLMILGNPVSISGMPESQQQQDAQAPNNNAASMTQ
jgi:hypothetical protein